MRKYIARILMLVCVLGLAGCSNKHAVLKSPPALTVTCGNETVEALRGTTSWHYQNRDGTGSGVEADCLHPLQCRQSMTPLRLIPTTVSSRNPLAANLHWDTMPDEVKVYCWDESRWGDYTAESEEIPVAVDSDTKPAPMISVTLKDGNHIYEVVAKWNSAKRYGGIVYYSFCTEKPNMELQPIG